MALSLMLRNAFRPQGTKVLQIFFNNYITSSLQMKLHNIFPGIHSLCKNTPIVYNNAAKFTQLSANNLRTMQKNTNLIAQIPKRTMHDHSFMWTVEKGVSASLLLVVPLGLAFPNMLFDNIMAILIAAHSHWYLLEYFNLSQT